MWSRSVVGLLLTLLVGVTLPGCGADNSEDIPIGRPEQFAVEIWARDFRRPTQMLLLDDGDLVVAELNGAENDGSGRILRVDADDRSDRTVLQSDLDKPTGIAVIGDRLWIMERDRLSVTTLDQGAVRQVVEADLPSNGRSEGTLTVTGSGDLLYNTSGSKRGADRTPGSGTLFMIEDAATRTSPSTVVATGFKHAYAHLVDHDDRLWSVEMTDGTFDGERGSDELVALEVGDDGGWPRCVDDNRPVIEFGGSEEACSQSPRSHALFGAGATPTSFVVAPWDDDLFVVALWLRGEVVTVPRRDPIGDPHVPTRFLSGIESPQHLLVDGSQLLVSDHATGTIYAVSAIDP